LALAATSWRDAADAACCVVRSCLYCCLCCYCSHRCGRCSRESLDNVYWVSSSLQADFILALSDVVNLAVAFAVNASLGGSSCRLHLLMLMLLLHLFLQHQHGSYRHKVLPSMSSSGIQAGGTVFTRYAFSAGQHMVGPWARAEAAMWSHTTTTAMANM